jgi:hypothetical protein
VLQEQQLEQLHDELHQDMFSIPTSFISTISKVESSRPCSSVLRSRGMFSSLRRGGLFSAAMGQCSTHREVRWGARGDNSPSAPAVQLVLVEVEQQLDVLQEQQLEQLHDELHQDMFSIPTSFISTISNVDSSRSCSSVRKSRDTISSFR